MTKIFTTPSVLLPIVDSVDGRGNGLGPCVSINVLCRKRELERIAMENKTWVSLSSIKAVDELCMNGLDVASLCKPVMRPSLS